MSHPSVSEAVVVPVQSESEGFAPIAYIVLAGGANLSEQELKLTCARKLKSFEMPKQFIFLEAMPRTFGGKVSRSDLAKIMFETGI
jgi:long-chain acyl-CoA synthetase